MSGSQSVRGSLSELSGKLGDTQKVLSNIPRDVKRSAPRWRKLHDDSMYYFACRCTK